MIFHKFLLINLFAVLSLSCSSIRCLDTPKKIDEILLPNNTDQAVLEVTTTAQGSVYPKEGDILQIRLFQNGRFEYDDFPDYNPPQTTSKNVVVTKKESYLSQEFTKELINLAEQPDFLSAEEKYDSLHQHIDTNWTTKIIFVNQGRQRTITVVNFWDTQYCTEDKSKYPQSMVALLEKVELFKAKAIGRFSSQWLTNSNKH